MSDSIVESKDPKVTQHDTYIPEIERLFAKKKKEDAERELEKKQVLDRLTSTLLIT